MYAASIYKKGGLMVQKYKVYFEDDMTHEEFGEGDGESIRFSIDGQNRVIDLSRQNAEKLRKAIQPFLAASRPFESTRDKTAAARGRVSGRVTSMDEEKERALIREWAKANGKRVSDRGRISADVVEEYQKAMSRAS